MGNFKRCRVVQYETSDKAGVISQVYDNKKHRIDWYPITKIVNSPTARHFHLNIIDEDTQRVIASTNHASSKNRIPLSFIEYYCNCCGLADCAVVEYRDNNPIVDNDNYVNVVKTKDCWDEQEVVELLEMAIDFGYRIGIANDPANISLTREKQKFIKEHLL